MNSQEVIESLNNWLSSFSEDTTVNICNLYDEKAFLWGTLSPLKLDNRSLIKDYFEQIFRHKNRNAECNHSRIRLFGDIAICNGQYTFSWFTFVYKKKNGRCFIIDHHSSFFPTTS